jgi:hypothetical protein
MDESRRRGVINVVRPAPDAQSDATVRGLCREARALTSALEMECWISSLLGQLWEQRDQAPPLELDRAFVLGGPFAEQIARSGAPGARLTLQAIAWVDRGGLGARCAQLADGLGDQVLPVWARDRGPVAVRRALRAGRDGEGEILCLAAEGGGRIAHTLAVFVDARQRGVAKHIHVLDALEGWAEEALGEGGTLGTVGVELPVPTAGERVIEAIARTEANPDAIVSESFADLRALALARAHACRRGAGRGAEGAAWLN